MPWGCISLICERALFKWSSLDVFISVTFSGIIPSQLQSLRSSWFETRNSSLIYSLKKNPLCLPEHSERCHRLIKLSCYLSLFPRHTAWIILSKLCSGKRKKYQILHHLSTEYVGGLPAAASAFHQQLIYLVVLYFSFEFTLAAKTSLSFFSPVVQRKEDRKLRSYLEGLRQSTFQLEREEKGTEGRERRIGVRVVSAFGSCSSSRLCSFRLLDLFLFFPVFFFFLMNPSYF